jgi:dihydrolipoamide dehydrogenase
MHADLIILGAGPGGYITAERAAQAGLKVLLVEKGELGGVCLNEGCIPSKTLLHSAKLFDMARNSGVYGVRAEGVSFDWVRAQARKEEIKAGLRKGIDGLMRRHGVEVIRGAGVLRADRSVEVNGGIHSAEHVVIATGSRPARPPIPGLDLPGVVDSTGVLALETLPESVVIIGGGVIGCEFACLFGSLGIPVTVVEMLPEICPSVDPELAKLLRGELAKKSVRFLTDARVEAVTEQEVRVAARGGVESLPRELVLVCTGRSPNVEGMGFESAGLDFDRSGIRTDAQGRTNLPGVWAIGDVTGKVWLAHAASRMGEVVVNTIQGRADRLRMDSLPGVVYTQPEVAGVGLTEAAARERGLDPVVLKTPMRANGRFLAEHDQGRGLVKVVVDRDSRRLLGVHLLGAACGEMIYGAAAMIESEFRVEEIRDLVFPHPTVSEGIRDSFFQFQAH